MFGDYPEFEDMDGNKYSFVRFIKPRNLLVWKQDRRNGEHNATCMGVRVELVDVEVLKKLEVWNQLGTELQKTIENHTTTLQNIMGKKMEKMRAMRKGREELNGVPREVTCCKCGKTQQIAPRQVLLRSGKAFKSVEDWCKEFTCQSCNPTKGRGRKVNPAYTNLPKELNCCKGCGTKIAIQPSSLVQRAKQKGISVDKFVANWACQKCVPTKGRKKGAKNRKK
jgi:hypothetical protein